MNKNWFEVLLELHTIQIQMLVVVVECRLKQKYKNIYFFCRKLLSKSFILKMNRHHSWELILDTKKKYI